MGVLEVGDPRAEKADLILISVHWDLSVKKPVLPEKGKAVTVAHALCALINTFA